MEGGKNSSMGFDFTIEVKKLGKPILMRRLKDAGCTTIEADRGQARQEGKRKDVDWSCFIRKK